MSSGDPPRSRADCPVQHRPSETERDSEEATLSIDLLRSLAAQLRAGVVVAAFPSGKLLLSNSAAGRMLGDAPPSNGNVLDFLDQRLRRTGELPTGDRPGWLTSLIAHGEDAHEVGVRLRGADNRLLDLQLDVVSVRRSTGDAAAVLLLLQEVPAGSQSDAERALWVRADVVGTADESSTALRDSFLATAAHELRTPLTTISGFSQLLERLAQQPDIDRERLQMLNVVLQKQVQRMRSLVDDLTQAMMLHDDALVVRRERCDLVVIAQDVVERAALFPERLTGHQIYLDTPPSADALCDPDHADQILSNLLSNALKFSPDGGAVRVTVRTAGDSVEISVSDQGLGITRHELAQLWQPLARTGRLNRPERGNGLGLYIARRLAERNQGTIDVTSTLGEGSTFTIRLPAWVDACG